MVFVTLLVLLLLGGGVGELPSLDDEESEPMIVADSQELSALYMC